MGTYRLFSNNSCTVLPITYHPGLSVRDVCEKAADEVGILPINLPFFTLVTVEGGHVINLQKKLTEQECKEDYEFRMTFKISADSGSYDKCALIYLFHQCRHDFLMKTNCKIKFPTTEKKRNNNTDKNDNENNIIFVRLVLSEITYQSRENHVKPTYILDNTSSYEIRHIFQRGLFSTVKFKEVKNYLKNNLKKFEDLDDTKLKLDYVTYIEKSQDYFVHKFHVNSIESNPYELLISSKFGIKKKRFHEDKKKADKENAIVIVDNFEEVSMLEIDQPDNTKLTISRTTGSTQVFYAQTPQEAQSIAAIIDGYYKLLVNRYKVLINQGRTFPVKFHGSITRQRAISKIQEYGTEDGFFLLRQSRDHYHEYVLSLYYNKKCEHYHICKENGEFYIEDTTRRFQYLKALIEYYKENKDGLVCCLSNNCPPSDEGFDALLDNQSDVHTSDRPQDLSQFGLETIESKTIHKLTEIGQGEFGSVINAQWRRHEKENTIEVAIRKIEKSTYNEEFFSVGKKLIELKNPNVIRCYGIVRMKNRIGLVMEYASQRLDDFLQKMQCNGFLTVKCIIQYAAQIAEGMMYLQEMDSIHGRLCAHTILVPKDPSNIKISDVGLLDLKQHGGQFLPGKVTQDRHCWHAPELLVYPDGLPTHESDAWSLGVTMWEMFTLKKPFHDSTGPLPREQIILNLLIMRQKYLDTERKIIPRDVAGVIEQCWNRGPEDRISFKAVVLELRKSLLKKGSQESLNTLVAPDKNYVEYWENKSIPADSKPTELLPATESNGFSIVASEKSTGKSSTLFTGSPSNGTSSSCSNLQFVPRKETLHRTNSDPVSLTNIYDQPMREKFRVHLTRTPSLSQLLSTPPTQTNHEDDKHVDNTRNNFQTMSNVDDHRSEQAETHSTFAHEQNIESEKLQFEENNSPTDESQIPDTVQDNHNMQIHNIQQPIPDTIQESQSTIPDTIQESQSTIPKSIQEDQSNAHKDQTMHYTKRPIPDTVQKHSDTIQEDHHTVLNDQDTIDNHETCEDKGGEAKLDLLGLVLSDEVIEMTVKPPLKTTNTYAVLEGDTEQHDDQQENITNQLMEEIRESEFIIPKQNLHFTGRLDSGNFGIVSKGILKRGSKKVFKEKEVAIKELRKTANDKSKEDFLREAINMAKLARIDNRNIIKFLGVCIEDSEDKIWIVTELAPFGNLKKYLKKVKGKESIKVSVLLEYCVQICSGMKELEKEDILHRDLALRNILVVTEDCVKISDFGLSRVSEYYISKATGELPLKWYAPESIEFNKFTSKSDVWSFGVTMWEVFSYGDSPYPKIDTTKVIDYIKAGNRLSQLVGCPDDIYEVMNQCWIEDRKTRPSFYLLYDTLSALLKDKYSEEQDHSQLSQETMELVIDHEEQHS